MPTAPKAAKVAKPKGPAKKALQKEVLEKKTAEVLAPKRPSNEKLPYNFRTRSLVRAIVEAVDDEAAKKEVRKKLKELRSFSEVKSAAIELAGEEQFNELLAVWFDAGEAKE